MEFREVENHPGYWVTNTGEVLSENYAKSDLAGFLKLRNNGQGYLQVSLKRKSAGIHRLVAKAFIPNPNNLPEVNHEDGDKTNNNVENLKWVTRSENEQHSLKNGLRKCGSRIYKTKSGWRSKIQIDGRIFTKHSQSKKELTDWLKEIENDR